MTLRRWRWLAALALGAAGAEASEFVEMRPGQFGDRLEVVDAFLAAVYGEGYTGNPLARTDAYLEFEGERAFLLVRHEPLCDARGCPLLIFEKERGGWGFVEETSAHSRVIGRDAIAHYGNELLWLYAEPDKTDLYAGSGFATQHFLEERYGPIYIDLKVDLDDVYVGHADVNGDGEDELFLFVDDPEGCKSWFPLCASAVLARGRPAAAGHRSYEAEGEDWSVVAYPSTSFLPCPHGGRCVAVLLLDQRREGFRSIMTAGLLLH